MRPVRIKERNRGRLTWESRPAGRTGPDRKTPAASGPLVGGRRRNNSNLLERRARGHGCVRGRSSGNDIAPVPAPVE